MVADYRTRNRTNSIFSDEDRGGERWRSGDYGWGGDPGREPRRSTSDDRGFFEKAGDEVRAWFGDDEAERRREQDAHRGVGDPEGDRFRRPGGVDHQSGGHLAGRTNSRHEPNRSRSNQASRPGAPWGDDEQGGAGDGGLGGVGQAPANRTDDQRFGGHYDETYRSWRDKQIAALDREYDDYRSHRQKQFEQEFSSFRQSRQDRITSRGAVPGQSGEDATAKVADPATASDGRPARTR